MSASTRKLNFLLGDDHHIVRRGIQFVIEDLVDEFEIFQAASLAEILEQIKAQEIDIAILDAQFPDGNSLSIIPEIRKLRPNCRLLIFSSFEEENYALKFIQAGANGFLNKLSDESEIQDAIQQIIENGEYYSTFTKKLLELSVHNQKLLNPLHQLSERELQVAELFAKGFGNLEIANSLQLKQNTVSTFKKRIFEKLNIENLLELIELMKIHHDN